LTDGAYSPKGEQASAIKKLWRRQASGVKVIYIGQVFSKDGRRRETRLPYYYKEGSLTLLRAHPEWSDKMLIRGTWGAQVVEELKPQEGTFFIEKPRTAPFSAPSSMLRSKRLT